MATKEQLEKENRELRARLDILERKEEETLRRIDSGNLRIRKQLVASFRSEFNNPYFFSIRAVTLMDGVTESVLRSCIAEMKLNLRNQGIVFKNFSESYTGVEYQKVSNVEDSRLLNAIYCQVEMFNVDTRKVEVIVAKYM